MFIKKILHYFGIHVSRYIDVNGNGVKNFKDARFRRCLVCGINKPINKKNKKNEKS